MDLGMIYGVLIHQLGSRLEYKAQC
jgi:hypothetical protein